MLTTLPKPPNREGTPYHEFLATPLAKMMLW